MLSAELKLTDKLSANLVIKNSGASIARNVSVVFDPPLPNSEFSRDGQRNLAPLINRRYERPIPVWVPGREMENFYWIRDQETPDDDAQSVDGIPRYVTVRISYTDDEDRHQYRDEFPLDVRELEGAAMPVEVRRHTEKRTRA